MACIVRSACNVPSFCSRHSFCSFPLSISFHDSHIVEKISFPPSSHSRTNEWLSSAPFFDLHQTTQSYIVLAFCTQISFSCFDKLSHITTFGPYFSPQKSRSPCLADWKKGGADIAASPSILVALLVCCSARNNAAVHAGDLYSASSNSSFRLVSFRIVAIIACSWPSQHSYFFRNFTSR